MIGTSQPPLDIRRLIGQPGDAACHHHVTQIGLQFAAINLVLIDRKLGDGMAGADFGAGGKGAGRVPEEVARAKLLDV